MKKALTAFLVFGCTSSVPTNDLPTHETTIPDAGADARPMAHDPEQNACFEPDTIGCVENSDCCDGSMCVTDGRDVFCSAVCTADEQCQSGCCAPVDETSSVCAQANVCSPPVTCSSHGECSTGCCSLVGTCAPSDLCTPPTVTCVDPILVARDATFLGTASSDIFAPDAVCNPFGTYGSQFSPTSIFNRFGEYGSPFGPLSAYNEFTNTPPRLYCVSTDVIMNAVSKNTFIFDAVDPDALCDVLVANGF